MRARDTVDIQFRLVAQFNYAEHGFRIEIWMLAGSFDEYLVLYMNYLLRN